MLKYKYFRGLCSKQIEKSNHSFKWFILRLTNVDYYGIWSFDKSSGLFSRVHNDLSNPNNEIAYVFTLEFHAHSRYCNINIFTNLKWYVEVNHRWVGYNNANYNDSYCGQEVSLLGFESNAARISISEDIPKILDELIKSEGDILDIQLR